MTQITITVDEQELARVRAQANVTGLSVEEWLRQLINQQTTSHTSVQPRDPFIGMFADDPEAADAIDQVGAERAERYKPRFDIP